MSKIVYAGQLNGAENPVVRDFLIKNSASVAVGEAVLLNSGVDSAGAGDKIMGICVGLYLNQIPLQNVPTADLDGTFNAATQEYTAASDNVTVKGVRAKVICDKDALFKIVADEAMTAVMEGQHFNLVSATQIDGNTNVAAAGQFELIKLDPADATLGTFTICESTRDAYVQQ